MEKEKLILLEADLRTQQKQIDAVYRKVASRKKASAHDPIAKRGNETLPHRVANPKEYLRNDMAFDLTLAERMRKQLGKRKGLVEKRMFGGLAFLLNGNMCCGVHGDEMIVRLDPAQTEQALRERHTRLFDLSGRPMKGWILVQASGLKTEAALAKWVEVGVKYASSLPAKK